ncbi:MAG: hypothetical protein VX961_06245, partial [Verrucomicrobiota bacterium]|nr:hypothetical protein [Verrucomicrobiota bacterium]
MVHSKQHNSWVTVPAVFQFKYWLTAWIAGLHHYLRAVVWLENTENNLVRLLRRVCGPCLEMLVCNSSKEYNLLSSRTHSDKSKRLLRNVLACFERFT